MKWGKLLSVVLIIVLVFIIMPFANVTAGTTYNIDISTINYVYRSSYGAVYFGVGATNWSSVGSIETLSSGSNTIHVYNDSGYNNTFNNVNLKYWGNNWALWFSLDAGTYYVDITCNNATYYDMSIGNTWILNGHFFGKAVIPSTGAGTLNNYTSSFTLIYNNDYNYTSNTASFTMQYSNFSFNYFTYLNTDIPGGSSLHLLTYNITQSGSTYIVHCSFDNTFIYLSNPHHLFWTVHGLDFNGNPIDLSGSTSFNINPTTAPTVPKDVLVITSPQTGDNFESGTTQIPVSVAYGGDVTNVTDPNYNHTSVTVGAVKALHNAGYVDLTSYSIINGTTIWSGTLTLNSGEGDGEYTLMASLDGTTLTSDTVNITIGGTTGNPVLDFLKAVWQEFKEWFVNTMKALFVPNATDFSSQIAQGWVQVSNPLPGVTPQYTIDIPMSTTLGTQNGVATIDFKTPITSWSGYSTMQSVIRVGLYTLLIFLIWSMVT